MKIFLTTLIFLLTFATVHAEPIPIRGIVEGFYGTPWTFETRLNMLDFLSTHGLNAYIYAPKDDPYHREKWRDDYPTDKLNEIKQLVKKARDNQVDFIFAVSPGLDLHFDNRAAVKDRKAMLKKLSTMYKIGIRHFAIFFDDIEIKNPEGQAEFLNYLQKNFVDKYYDIAELITVPTEYFHPDMKDYTKILAENLDSKILVLYTGEAVVGPALSDEDFAEVGKIYKNLGIWWNYPVNDYMEGKLALGAINHLPKNSNIPAIFFNPMKFAELSKITLSTAADYAKDPLNYSAVDSWNSAIDSQFGILSESMKIFADHSQHLENNWANCGADDGLYFKQLTDEIFSKLAADENADELIAVAFDEIEKMSVAVENLQNHLPKKYLDECQPQLDLFKTVTKLDKIALQVLKEYSVGNKKNARLLSSKLSKNFMETESSSVKISEKSAVNFIRRVIDFSNQL